MNTSLDGRIAIISGAAHGMGKAGVKTFIEAGATVVVADVRAGEAEATAREVEAADGRVLAIQVDATDPESVTSMVDQVMKTFGRIDVLWNCVGGMGWQPDGKRKTEDGRGPLDGGYDILNLVPEEWDWSIRLNLTTVYLMCRAVLPHMIAAGKGSIISMGDRRRARYSRGRNRQPPLQRRQGWAGHALPHDGAELRSVRNSKQRHHSLHDRKLAEPEDNRTRRTAQRAQEDRDGRRGGGRRPISRVRRLVVHHRRRASAGRRRPRLGLARVRSVIRA